MNIRLRDRIACAKHVFNILSEMSGVPFEHLPGGMTCKVLFRGSGDTYMVSVQVTAVNELDQHSRMWG